MEDLIKGELDWHTKINQNLHEFGEQIAGKADTSDIGDKEQLKTDDKSNIVNSINEVKEQVDTDKSSNEQQFKSINDLISNLSINDALARREILDIKLKLDENDVIDFINKTGIGFFDLFKDASNIDTSETTASIVNTDAVFTGDQVLQFIQEHFDDFKSIELAIYDSEREIVAPNGYTANSDKVDVTAIVDSISQGDKFYFNGEIYTVNSVELEE
ncbi:hypothetical protein KM803_13025 [Clostridium tyrobutyricum]|uniref:hypothetical protein n=1 Tax=Clostridium tyrobutyricum TaxID=1519 RepID=UPI0018A0F2AD|nr:hypothetical protein [Clostridium tyrobutyricum]MBV4432240.1 hypothetical protein [Clostridium tyrobutyricum]